MKTYELHPLCVLFPRLVGAEFDALRDDIRANGLRAPIVLHDGMILDGGNRYRACVEADCAVPRHRETFDGSLARGDEVVRALGLSATEKRRQSRDARRLYSLFGKAQASTSGQRAVVVAQIWHGRGLQ